MPLETTPALVSDDTLFSVRDLYLLSDESFPESAEQRSSDCLIPFLLKLHLPVVLRPVVGFPNLLGGS